MRVSFGWNWVLLGCFAHASAFPQSGSTPPQHETSVAGESLANISRPLGSPLPPNSTDLDTYPTVEALPIPPYAIVRHVLGTRTIVYAYIQAIPIPQEAIGVTIKRMQIGIEGVMASIGDGWLPADRDPYSADIGYGCYISMQSNSVPGPGGRKQHLTWGIMNSTLEGLFHIAYVQRYNQEMRFKVLDSGRGIVANGSIKAGHLGLEKGDDDGMRDRILKEDS